MGGWVGGWVGWVGGVVVLGYTPSSITLLANDLILTETVHIIVLPGKDSEYTCSKKRIW